MCARHPAVTPLDLDTAASFHNPLVVDYLSMTFAALSDPTRRAMVHRLTLGPATIHALTEPFNLSQQMISKHVACLVRALRGACFTTARGSPSVWRFATWRNLSTH